MPDILYIIFIYPLEQIIELSYILVFRIFHNPALSVLGVSFAVSILTLPLYFMAERHQNSERDIQKRLKPEVDSIKAVFSGNERFMRLATYYRQNGYHPVYSLRSSISLIIQIPFFIAAYHFISHLDYLKGASFFFISDLSVPDGLLNVNGVRLNLLPVLMTIINCIAGAIYTRNLYAKDRIQIYGMAAVFLVLLYNSPSGLVLYWTMNNIFSLLKNIFLLLKKPLVILYIILCCLVLSLDVFLIFLHEGDLYRRILFVIISLVIPLLPLVIKGYSFMSKSILEPLNTDINTRLRLFVFSQIVYCLLIGLIIPSSVIASSPQEFSFIESVDSPFIYLQNTFFQGVGFFIFWPFCLYFLFGDKTKTVLALFSVFLCFWAIINNFLFPGAYGELTGILHFVNDKTLKPPFDIAAINIIVLIFACGIIVFLIWKNRLKFLSSALFIMILAFIVNSFVNGIKINREYKNLTAIRLAMNGTDKTLHEASPIFHLSTGGKNVIVIMLDRGVNIFVHEIFSESPQLYSQFSGFTWYPNTLSFNGHTLIGAPPLFGGYEYQPWTINRRTTESLVKKHNESLLLMPLVFSGDGFAVTVTDPPWANYSWIPDIRIYDAYPEINVVNTKNSYINIWLSRKNIPGFTFKSQLLKRNFLWFSFFKSAPMILRTALYDGSHWLNTNSVAVDLPVVLDKYAVLDLLSELTNVSSTTQNTFLLLVNELPHEPVFLQAPDYVPAMHITNRGASKYADMENYHVNAASLKRLGTWFEFMKQNGLYDNTRIIICADHGADIVTNTFSETEGIPFRREIYNPLMLVKDFDADFPFKTDMDFMTNADVPTLAFKGLIPDPVNPFTGNPVNDTPKREPLHITTSDKYMPYGHNANTFKISGNEWYTVHSDIFNADNWQKKEP
jgi:YidC/Oxa1 family membrane protein insertase